MIPISKPTVSTISVFEDCISNVRSKTHKLNLTNCTQTILDSTIDFDIKFPQNEIYNIPRSNVVVSPIGKDEMIYVYNTGMLQSELGRKHYDRIKASAPDNICPLCSIRTVSQVDHYLPKTQYPVFSIVPINLIPSCSDCNEKKKIAFPTSNTDQTLHPYYDDVNNENWIKATLIQKQPISFNFYADPPSHWDDILKQRVINHFNSFNLNEVFSSNANRRLTGDKQIFLSLYNLHPSLLKKHLWEGYQSNLSLGVNSYEAVLFRTLYNDDWFCEKGVLL